MSNEVILNFMSYNSIFIEYYVLDNKGQIDSAEMTESVENLLSCYVYAGA